MQQHIPPHFIQNTYTTTEPYQVSREKIREFATATCSTHPAHHNLEAAKKLGYPDLLAPPTFNIILAQKNEHELLKNPEINLNNTHIIHLEQKIYHNLPVIAGEELHTTTTITTLTNRNTFTLLTTTTTIQTTNNILKSTLTSSIMIKENPKP